MDKGTIGQRGRIRAPRALSAVLAVLLLAVGAAALDAARGSAAHEAGPLARQWWLFAAAAVLGGILAMVGLRRRLVAADPVSSAESRLHRGALALVAVATVAVPVALFLVHKTVTGGGTSMCTTCPIILDTHNNQTSITQLPIRATTPPKAAPVKLPLAVILVVLGSVLAAVIVATVLVVLMRLWAARGKTPVPSAPPEASEDEHDASVLSMAVLAGRDALEGEARAAIIGCYAAMEESLAAAGVPRLASDSPADLLARATERGVLDGPAPRLLARLFREARFSSHAMDARHLGQARGALDEIAAQLAAGAAAGSPVATAAAAAAAGPLTPGDETAAAAR